MTSWNVCGACLCTQGVFADLAFPARKCGVINGLAAGIRRRRKGSSGKNEKNTPQLVPAVDFPIIF